MMDYYALMIRALFYQYGRKECFCRKIGVSACCDRRLNLSDARYLQGYMGRFTDGHYIHPIEFGSMG
jgi:hypothetical protein